MAEEEKQPVAEPAAAPAEAGATPAKKKWWLWAIIALAVIAVGVGAYFLI